MAVKTAQYIFNGQAYNLTYNSTSGKWEATVTAPSKSSYNQPDHVLGGTVKAIDEAGNTTTVDQSHATLGASLKLRVKEKTAPISRSRLRLQELISQIQLRLSNSR